MKLSICIPTYNFGSFIGATLDSIVAQLADDVEIVILDGGSTDDTGEVVARVQARCPRLKYQRNPVKGGIDRDMAGTVALATGTYCWLFSGDDLMRPGAIATVLRWIESASDVYLCRHSNCALDMTYFGDHPVLRSNEPLTAELADPLEQAHYFSLAITTEAFFSFMGSLIVRKAKWDVVSLNKDFVGSCWAHVARLFELMPHGLRVTYSPEVLLDRRGDNDSFAHNGMVNRFRIAIDGYHRLADTFLGARSDLAFYVRRAVRNEYGFRQFMVARIQCRRSPGSEDERLLRELLQRTYCDAPLQGRLIWLMTSLIPSAAYGGLRDIYRHCRRGLRSA